MGDDNVVSLVTDDNKDPQAEVIKALEEALAQAKSGDCIGIALVQFNLNATYDILTEGDTRLLTMLGGVEMLSDYIRDQLSQSLGAIEPYAVEVKEENSFEIVDSDHDDT